MSDKIEIWKEEDKSAAWAAFGMQNFKFFTVEKEGDRILYSEAIKGSQRVPTLRFTELKDLNKSIENSENLVVLDREALMGNLICPDFLDFLPNPFSYYLKLLRPSSNPIQRMKVFPESFEKDLIKAAELFSVVEKKFSAFEYANLCFLDEKQPIAVSFQFVRKNLLKVFKNDWFAWECATQAEHFGSNSLKELYSTSSVCLKLQNQKPNFESLYQFNTYLEGVLADPASWVEFSLG